MEVDIDPTLTPELHPIFSALIVAFSVGLLIVEVVGIRRKQPGDTITENWRWVERWLPNTWAWLFRVLTGGILVWAILHFLAGAD